MLSGFNIYSFLLGVTYEKVMGGHSLSTRAIEHGKTYEHKVFEYLKQNVVPVNI